MRQTRCRLCGMLVDHEERAMLEHFDYYHTEEQDE
jgi:hypothetical protein